MTTFTQTTTAAAAGGGVNRQSRWAFLFCPGWQKVDAQGPGRAAIQAARLTGSETGPTAPGTPGGRLISWEPDPAAYRKPSSSPVKMLYRSCEKDHTQARGKLWKVVKTWVKPGDFFLWPRLDMTPEQLPQIYLFILERNHRREYIYLPSGLILRPLIYLSW